MTKQYQSIIIVTFIVLGSLFSPSKISAAEEDNSCQCTADPTQGVIKLKDNCKTDYVAKCWSSSEILKDSSKSGCDCELSQAGVNCAPENKTATPQIPCCKGLIKNNNDLCQKSSSSSTSTSTTTPYQICNAAGPEKEKCETCLANGGILTALGCIHFDPQTFIEEFLKIALGISGGIALLLMVYGAFLISISAGDPKKADEGKEMITGTIAGLLFIVFSVFLLKLIGVDILQIPGF